MHFWQEHHNVSGGITIKCETHIDVVQRWTERQISLDPYFAWDTMKCRFTTGIQVVWHL